MLEIGDKLRVLVGRQHGGVAVYMQAEVEAVTEQGYDVLLDATGAQVKVLDLVDTPEVVRAAIKAKPSAPRLTLVEAQAEEEPPLWRSAAGSLQA